MVTICDVGPRDGLQNDPVVLPVATRLELIDRLAAAGCARIEVASFVNPRLVPAMAGAEEIYAGLKRAPGVLYTGLILNEKGYERALAAGAERLRYGLSVTDEFGLRNQNMTCADGVEQARRLIGRARRDGIDIEIALSVAFGCPFSGRVDPARVLRIVEQLMPDPPDEISLADTIGVAVPSEAGSLVRAAVEAGAVVNAHFHDTRNTAIANVLAALEAGATSLDASVGGTGGCPFAPRATGNVATEDVVYLLERMGVETGIDLQALIDTSHWLGEHLGKELPSSVARAGIPAVAALPA